MARVAFTLTEPQIAALTAIAAGRGAGDEGGDLKNFDTRTLDELARRGWLEYEGYSSWSAHGAKLSKKGRAVAAMIRALELHKERGP
jgi:hypothetical protein